VPCMPTATGARAIRRALELWPEEADERARLDAMERLARCAELAGAGIDDEAHGLFGSIEAVTG
jgi:hypothetical protein